MRPTPSGRKANAPDLEWCYDLYGQHGPGRPVRRRLKLDLRKNRDVERCRQRRQPVELGDGSFDLCGQQSRVNGRRNGHDGDLGRDASCVTGAPAGDLAGNWVVT